MPNKIIWRVLGSTLLLSGMLWTHPTHAQTPVEENTLPTSIPGEENITTTFFRGEITSITTSPNITNGVTKYIIKVHATTPALKDQTLTIEYTLSDGTDIQTKFRIGDTIVGYQSKNGDTIMNFIVDTWRLPKLIILFFLFVIMSLALARKQGLRALIGLFFSVLVLMLFIVPNLASGGNVVLVGGIGATLISIFSLLLAHGFKKSTFIALASMLITILFAWLTSILSLRIMHLVGNGSEDAYNLTFAFGNINLQGLLLIGIIIGTLGVLDDVTTGLAVSIEEIKKADPKLNASELSRRGLRVGSEHIVSLINTLVFAYAGAAMPLLMLMTLDLQPMWVTFNSAFMAEEIVRTLIGSMTLMLAVPITTAIASRVYGKK